MKLLSLEFSLFTPIFVAPLLHSDAVQQDHHSCYVHQARLPTSLQCHHLGQTGTTHVSMFVTLGVVAYEA